MDSSLQSFILTECKMAGRGKNVLSKEKKGKKNSHFGVNVLCFLICILNALIKIISKLLTTSAHSTGHQNVFFGKLMSGICLCLLWHQQLAGTQTPSRPPFSKHGNCKNNKDALADVLPQQRLTACLSGVNQRINRERDEASLTHAMWVKNPDDFIYLFFILLVRQRL